jgi:hypothetical protein
MTGLSADGVQQSPHARAAVAPLAWVTAIVATAVFVSAPWLDERLVPAGWLGVAAGLVLATGRQGWRGELAVLASAVLAIAIAFHWTPEVLADAMRTSKFVGFAFAVLQQRRSDLCTVAMTLSEQLATVGYPAYIEKTLTSNTIESVRAQVEAAVGDIARRFKNLHHKLQH